MSGLIKYGEDRALEDAAFTRGVAPTRLCRVLLPVWEAEIRATILDSEPYDLIDRYVDAGVASCGLDSMASLAAFLGLNQVVVDRAVRFLVAIGHLSVNRSGRIKIEELGLASVRDGRRYSRALEDRRKLYFDGFTAKPLTKPYYDDRLVTFLDTAALSVRHDGPSFTPVVSMSRPSLDNSVLAHLAALTDRDQYNLPAQVLSPSLASGPVLVFLPAYVVRAVGQDGRPQYLAYTQVSDAADPAWSQVCSAPEIMGVLDNEHFAARDEEGKARQWLEARVKGRFQLTRTDGGVLTATVSAGAFTPRGGEEGLSKLGSFVMLNTGFFLIWCADEGIRRHALLERAKGYLHVRTRVDAAEAVPRLGRFGYQLGFGYLSVEALRKIALEEGETALAVRLAALAEDQ